MRDHGKRIEPETLGGLAAKQLDVWTWCWGCCHSAVLSTAGLIERLGAGGGARCQKRTSPKSSWLTISAAARCLARPI